MSTEKWHENFMHTWKPSHLVCTSAVVNHIKDQCLQQQDNEGVGQSIKTLKKTICQKKDKKFFILCFYQSYVCTIMQQNLIEYYDTT